MTTRRQREGVIIGVDTGGTFTDVTLLDPVTGRIWSAKTPSTPDDPSRGFGSGIGEALAAAGLSGSDVARVLHGTTIATNLILEGKGARTALITTAGFKYVLEIGRQDVPRSGSLFAWVKPKRPVPPERIFEVGGRIGPDGQELEPLDEAAIRMIADAIRAEGVAAIAVVLLHSYANPAHERRVAAILADALPGLPVTVSSDVLPVFREYERSMTTVLNAGVLPVVASYVQHLDARIAERGITAPLLLMKSSGGVTSTRTVLRAPVETALSGPAAGAVGAVHVGASCGHANLIGIDIGGTSADISLIHNGEPGLTTNGRVGNWPIGLPMIDIVTIGAGGGSVARVSDAGALTVGPLSAGAVPGPACYGRGGTEPTVTDAHLALGHLPPYLLGGQFRLDLEAARLSIRDCVANPLGISVEDAARGILAITDNNMVGAIRVVSVERGHDPRDFSLLPFGGAGPLHAGALARLLGMRTIVVPPEPGVLSALGLLVSNLKAEFTRTCLQRSGALDTDMLARVFAELDGQARNWLDDEAVPEAARRVTWHASMRYQHQGFELFVPWTGRDVTEASAAASVAAFHRLHERLYTFAQEDTPVEIVTLRVDARGVFPAPALRELPPARPLADARAGTQTVFLDSGPVDAAIYARGRLGAGARIDGPAILTQLDATTLLLPGQIGTVDRLGNLIIVEST
ncbi:MAG TPA: hydantoinase/oxoprolinase family protein [Hyphomicrobiaceae bacterium]|nr:hydantoinase/oxoprolinase family protein [Hyphomicrobiaceae bacterium]